MQQNHRGKWEKWTHRSSSLASTGAGIPSQIVRGRLGRNKLEQIHRVGWPPFGIVFPLILR